MAVGPASSYRQAPQRVEELFGSRTSPIPGT